MDSVSSSSSSSSSSALVNTIREDLIGMGYTICQINQVMARNPKDTESAVGWIFTMSYTEEEDSVFGDLSMCAICYNKYSPNALPCHPRYSLLRYMLS